jgi:hypothetical protein
MPSQVLQQEQQQLGCSISYCCHYEPWHNTAGKGIFLAETVEGLAEGTSYGKDKSRQTFIIQPLMKNPYLVQGHKFDLRCYVMVVSYQPVSSLPFNRALFF